MANENNNINELVADDDDPTVELELPTFRNIVSEADAKTFDSDSNDADDEHTLSAATGRELRSELRTRQEDIDRLQFDYEQLHAQWLGLQSETEARAEQSEQLNEQLAEAKDQHSRKEKLIKKRDRKITLLKTEIRERDEQHRKLLDRFNDLQSSLDNVSQAPEEEDTDASPPELPENELERRLARSEEYADSIRRQLQDLMETNANANREIDHLSSALEAETRKALELGDQRTETTRQIETLQEKLDSNQADYEQEVRTLRFELGTAEDTMVEAENVKSQLASDLVSVQEHKLDLEKKLDEAKGQLKTELAILQSENEKLTHTKLHYEQELAAKSEAITVLLAELAKKSQASASVSDDSAEPDTPADQTGSSDTNEPHSRTDQKYSRVLVGSVDNQVLRFPLFKDRITIGRTKDNDIQLEAAYVSRRHAVIQTDDDATRIIDRGSKNGIYVNSQRIHEHLFRHGDIVVVGRARFRYEEHKKRDS